MRLIDLYFEAFRAFRKQTEADVNSQKLRKVISHSNQQQDTLTTIVYDCEVEEIWIQNIEEGLIYIEKAIREDRQFIRTQGEVVQIEKVKRVSKASIEHLSRHSDMITRAPKSTDIRDLIPDKLYVVEKLSDYLVYENRFLYMLLCYLKDFIQIRLDKIRDKMTTYESTMAMNKDIKANQRSLTYQLNYDDTQKNDPFLADKFKEIPIIHRLETIYAMVVSFLSTPLMKEVSKAPMIKPPVIKTNVLRMNPNFRAALKLYDFVTSYNVDGYQFHEVKKTFQPFTPQMADEIAETIELTSAIAYITSNDIRDYLTKKIELKEQALLEAENKKTLDELKRLKKRIVEMNEDPSAYILKLEKRNVQLEKESANLAEQKETNALLMKQIEALEAEKIVLTETINQQHEALLKAQADYEAFNQKYFDDMTTAESIHQAEIAALIAKHEAHVASLHSAYQQQLKDQAESYEQQLDDQKTSYELKLVTERQEHEQFVSDLNQQHSELTEALITKHAGIIDSLIQKHDTEISNLLTKHELEVSNLVTQHETEQTNLTKRHDNHITLLNHQIDELTHTNEQLRNELVSHINVHKESVQAYELKIDTLEKQIQRLEDEKRFMSAQHLAFKQQQGLLTDADDFTTKEKFKQLELEMIAYKKLFKEQWKKTKQRIRENVKQNMHIESSNTDSKDSDQDLPT